MTLGAKFIGADPCALEVLLLQIDSFDVDGEWFLMWGDAGIANFFIKLEDVKIVFLQE